MLEIKDIFIGKAKKYNHYQKSDKQVEGRKCRQCRRWQFSFPYTCNDYKMDNKKAETCFNFTTDKFCDVD